MATWEQVRNNPTLFSKALQPGEGERLHWHRHADQPHSSQVFCVSAFGTLRHLPVRAGVVGQLLGQPVGTTDDSNWSVCWKLDGVDTFHLDAASGGDTAMTMQNHEGRSWSKSRSGNWSSPRK